MELYFNELSIKDKGDISYDDLRDIVNIYRELLKYNIRTCRIAADDNTKLFQMIGNVPDSMNVRNFYFSFFRSPYESEAAEESQDSYFEYSWTYNNEECIGFALAFLLNSASLSIHYGDFDTPYIEICRDADSTRVRNICKEEHVALHVPQILNIERTEPLKSDLQISDKKIILRNDHGMDVLEAFSKRLIRSPYLIGIINSLPYNPYERKFIKRIRENGLIEIVLPWTDEGYGLIAKTTGRTIAETKKIAEIIEEEFGYI